ncbi:MAG TPA: IMP cyclohydrolase [Candidatus Faecousia faecigallinarum]|nr:IMP cyclohydrolase [Candidatus Faecousia faecigallinarum]
MEQLSALLKGNAYPGRGIVLGRSQDGKYAVVAYFIMGRSENSRNRIFVETQDGIRTQAYDPAKMTDPSLIIYHPVRRVTDEDGVTTIVTNGDQTDTLRDFMLEGESYVAALNTREFEPDGPNYTPRISGIVYPSGSYMLSILKSLDGDPSCCLRHYFTYDAPRPGLGHFLHTYQGDGNPLPSFQGEPRPVEIAGDLDTFTGLIWQGLNPENKVSLFTSFIDLETGAAESRIVNKHS